MNIGHRIKQLRKSRGWTQTQLVSAARQYIPEGKVLARETMSRIENGHRPPDLWVVSAIAQAMGLTSGEIIDGAETEPLALRLRVGEQPSGVAGLVERLELLPAEIRLELTAGLSALLDVLLTAFEGIGLSENERELLRYLREASPERREAIHRLIAAAIAEEVGPDGAVVEPPAVAPSAGD
jgi:transcriptional regulator with XRE-family HTH domain